MKKKCALKNVKLTKKDAAILTETGTCFMYRPQSPFFISTTIVVTIPSNTTDAIISQTLGTDLIWLNHPKAIPDSKATSKQLTESNIFLIRIQFYFVQVVFAFY